MSREKRQRKSISDFSGELGKKLNGHGELFWDFAEFRESKADFSYPAKMVAPMQKQILSDIVSTEEASGRKKKICDPFAGSGTVLAMGRELGLDPVGFDLNPLAVLITRVRLEGIPKDSFASSFLLLSTNCASPAKRIYIRKFPRIDKWFRPDIQKSLSLIKGAISEEKEPRLRRFYWCCFAETVKRFSNTRTSTFKLHSKKELDIAAIKDGCVSHFLGTVEEKAPAYLREEEFGRGFSLSQGDSAKLFREKIKPGSMDIVCTSPPYGDNKTTVPYGQFSILPLKWIPKADLPNHGGKLLENYSSIDAESLGGLLGDGKARVDQYLPYVGGVSERKRAKVFSFFADYERCFSLMSSSLRKNGILVLTLGDRRVDRVKIRFDKFNDALAKEYNLLPVTTLRRKILNKRMPSRVSDVDGKGSVPSITLEYVKIYIRT